MANVYSVQIAKPCEITADDLHDAYVFARLRRLGIGLAKVIETPHLYAALRCTALAKKRKQQREIAL